jgi:hypothetical protein
MQLDQRLLCLLQAARLLKSSLEREGHQSLQRKSQKRRNKTLHNIIIESIYIEIKFP